MGQEILYYCEADSDGKLTIHRGGKEGPVIATANPCLTQEGQTDIHLHEPQSTFTLQHEHHKLPFIHCKSKFVVNDKHYHWEGHSKLVADETHEVVTTFTATWLEGTGHKIGVLDIKAENIKDITVITALVVQERSDEHKRSVKIFSKFELMSI